MKRFLLLTILVLGSYIIKAQGLDVSLNQITMSDLVNLNNTPVNAEAVIRNIGDVTVNSFDVGMSVDGGTPIVFPISGLTLAQGENYNLTRLNAWNPEMLGRYTITMWVTNINGGATDVNSLNDTLSKSVEVIDEFISRDAFHEVFTSSTCGPCNPGNINTDNVWNASSRTPVIIKYQMSWPGSGDPYYTAEGNARRNYYSVNSVPNMQIDGGWNGNSNSYSNAILESYSDVPAFLEVESNFTVTGKTVDINLAIKPLKDLKGNNKLHCAIIEKTTFNNIKSNGETVFHDVMKKMVPNENGTYVGNIYTGQPLTYELSYTFQGNYRLPSNATNPINHSTEHSVEEFTDLGVIIWVQNVGSKDVFHASYSADKQTNLDLSFASITTPENVLVNQNTNIEGIIVNNQNTQITSFDVVYRIDGGAELRENVSGVMLSKGDSMTFTHASQWMPTSTGLYKVEAWIDNINGAGQNTSDDLSVNDEAHKYIISSTTLGNLPIHDIAKTVNVYPNPSNGIVHINSISHMAKSVEVYTMMGELITKKSMGTKGIFDLDLSNENSGLYVLRFQTANGVFSKRVVIQ
ncbi:MAG: T9SS type A sorting domain-containing protein [Cytophagales bacterium]